MDIFERVKIRLESGKDFPPEMVEELVNAYESRLAEISGKLTQRAVDMELVRQFPVKPLKIVKIGQSEWTLNSSAPCHQRKPLGASWRKE